VTEEIVERTDRSREERRCAPDQIALDPVDVEPVRNDEPGLSRKLREKTFEQQSDLAGVRRTHDQRETHRSIVVPVRARFRTRSDESVQRAWNSPPADRNLPNRRFRSRRPDGDRFAVALELLASV
jgi:hypothetical protein